MTNHEVLTIDEVAELLHVDRRSVKSYIDQGFIKAIKLGPRLYRILRKDVEFLFEAPKADVKFYLSQEQGKETK